MDPNDQPLGQQFYLNPLQYMQNYVRNMNNELFLSEYQINNLYALLLIGRSSPWDSLKPNSFTLKMEIDCLVQKKVNDVKFILDNLSQLYEDKVKKSTLNQIQKLMGIIRAKNKSIFIQKIGSCRRHADKNQQSTNNEIVELQQKQPQRQNRQEQKTQKPYHEPKQDYPKSPLQINTQIQSPNEQKLQIQKTNKNRDQEDDKGDNIEDNKEDNKEDNRDNKEGDEHQVFSLFYGLANIGKITVLAMKNALEYNDAERYVRFNMSRNYMMTIKNDDPNSFDLVSKIKDVPSDIFVHHLFPFLTAPELFSVRGVCKEWLQNVKEAWHATFKREMFVQLLACQFCKDIEFFYKLIQLRNPFFQKISLLLHALIQIIQWDTVYEAVTNGTVSTQLKRVLIVLLKLIGEPVTIRTINDVTEELWEINKPKIMTLKDRINQFFSNLNANTDLSINDLRNIKIGILDHPFMRVEEMNTEDKTPLLLSIFIKQLTLQQIIRCHIFFSQQYLMNSKRRLDLISLKMPPKQGYLEGVYKILLLKSMNRAQEQQDDSQTQLPNFHQLLHSIFHNQHSDKPDFVIRTKATLTNIFIDRATKLDIIVSTVRKIVPKDSQHKVQKINNTIQQINQSKQQVEKEAIIQQQKQMNDQANLQEQLHEQQLKTKQQHHEKQ